MLKTFSYVIVQAVWEKGYTDPYRDARLLRKDQCGAWIQRDQYGNRNSDVGWEIDHITPEANGGSDSLNNLRPLQWRNNASRRDGRLTCPVIARV